MLTSIRKLYKALKAPWVELEHLRNAQARRLTTLEQTVAAHTTVSGSVNYRGPNVIVVLGRYKNTDYVEFYTVNPSDFSLYIEEFRQRVMLGHIGTLAAPPSLKQTLTRNL